MAKLGEVVTYDGVYGKLVEISGIDGSRSVMQTTDGREYLVDIKHCTTVSNTTKERCPRCVYEGKPGELFENATLKRCYECSSDYKFELKEGKIQEPVRGMKAILG